MPQQDNPIELSIVIVSWNVRQLLGDCLESIYAYPPAGSFETLVVDNQSKDGSAEMVAARFPQVRLIESGANLGFAGGNNLGLRQACGRDILLLNPDTRLLPGALGRLMAFLVAEPKAGAAGARLFNEDGSLQTSAYPAPTLGREFWRMFHLDALIPLGEYRMTDWPVAAPRRVEILKGACILLRRQVLEQVGLFDEAYFMYSEETDLCYRIQRAGWELYWVPAAAIYHLEGQSTKQVAVEMFLQLYRSKIRFFRKHYNPFAVGGYKLLLGAAAAARLGLAPLARLEPEPRRARHQALADRYRRLLAALPGM